ncbi:alpha/beta fold hydrolase [Acuticoccus mangrovi]|uniref:Alpha/beta fold hydrolase n=1 Tax=Acuticoccus mangrovi TaxID=2796142 RepID=A0A934ILB9_9HYPH|nr:alpha/beta fold hydrolase [Acuticoccus mangrovi]MBJ3778623.1 alpha/beta fold hydrolase [Acuticoccus mangrovi]
MTLVRIGPSPHIAVAHRGPSDGELVVFLHGVGGGRDNWSAALEATAAAGFHAAAWDGRGYGDSDDAPLAWADFRHDLRKVIDHFDAPRAHLVGLSMGARIALDTAAAWPERVASLVLADTHLGFRHLSARDRALFVAKRRDPLLAGKTPADIAPGLARTLVGDRDDTATIAALVASMSRLRTAGYVAAIECSVAEDLDPLVDRISLPTLVVVGARDRVTPPALAEEIAARIGGATLVILPGAGHLSNIEAPAAFNAALVDFLTGVRAGR